MDEFQVRHQIKKYIAVELIRDPDYPIGDNEGLITEGLMDSFALADLAVYIEREFNVYIPDPELTVEKMDTTNQIVARVMADSD